MTTIIRCSALPLVWKCASSTETQLGETVIDESSEATEAGNAAHRYAAARAGGVELDVGTLAREHAVDVDELQMLCAGVRAVSVKLRQYVGETTMMAEVPLEFDMGDGVTVVGTADLMGRPEPKAGLIVDYKSGRLDSDHTHQLRGYALGGHRALGDVDTMTIITAWLRTGQWDVEHIAVSQLEDWRRAFATRIENGRGKFNPGAHCGFCSRASNCPGRREMVHRTLADLTAEGVPVIEWTPETRAALGPQIGEMYGRVRLAEKAAEAFREVLKSDIQQYGEIPIGEGRELALLPVNRRELDAAKARPVLARFLDQDEIDRATRISASQCDDMVAGKAGRGKGAGAKRELNNALTQAGALTVNQTHALREVKAARADQSELTTTTQE